MAAQPSTRANPIWFVAIGQTLFWASTFYVFHAMLPRWESWFGWTRIEVATGLTVALLSTAVFAPVAGMLIDRGKGRLSMTAGGSVASLCLLALSQVTRLEQFYVLWFVLGICHATILYEPCFAILTRRFGQSAKRAITTVTLIAGFAGTLSFPTAYFLTERIGWQKTLWVFSLCCVAGTVISNLSFKAIDLRAGTNSTKPATLSKALEGTTWRIVSSRMFWLTTIAFSLIMLTHGSLLAHLVPLMLERGFDYGAGILVLSMIGPMQIVGRIIMLSLQAKLPTDSLTLIAFSAISCACLILLLSGNHLAFVLVFVCLYGAGYGVTSIAKPTVTAQFFGSATFGTVSGIMAVPFTACFALAPTLAAFVWSQWGYNAVLTATIGFTLLSVFTLWTASRLASLRIRTENSAN